VPERRRFAREIRGSDILIPVGVAVPYVLAAKLGLGPRLPGAPVVVEKKPERLVPAPRVSTTIF
jgi:hypothetical protein